MDYVFYTSKSGRITGLRVHRKRRLTKSERLQLIKSQNGLCHYCNCEMKWIENGDPDDGNLDGTWATIDHKIPWIEGGATDFSNCVASCRSCNVKKGRNHV